jgi:serine/threonine protein kinase
LVYIRHLEKYDHENIVRLLDVCQGPRLPSEQSIILIFEFIDYDLDNYVKSNIAQINHAKIVDLTRQILNGVDFLHMNRIIHVNIDK